MYVGVYCRLLPVRHLALFFYIIYIIFLPIPQQFVFSSRPCLSGGRYEVSTGGTNSDTQNHPGTYPKILVSLGFWPLYFSFLNVGKCKSFNKCQ